MQNCIYHTILIKLGWTEGQSEVYQMLAFLPRVGKTAALLLPF